MTDKSYQKNKTEMSDLTSGHLWVFFTPRKTLRKHSTVHLNEPNSLGVKTPTVSALLLTLLLAAVVGEEANYVLGCPLVHLCLVVVGDPDGGSCHHSPVWKAAWVYCHERGACAQSPHAHEWGSHQWVVCLFPRITW